MTDFASQGKTRPFNPVDLNNCRSHQAYYTALSRSASAAGTIILQGFDARKITGKASGALRQEFRDLELLDEITKLRFLNKLPGDVVGDRRNDLIHSYRVNKGMGYVPDNVHESLKWSDSDPMLDPLVVSDGWNVVTAKSIAADSTPEKKRGVKRQMECSNDDIGAKKKRKVDEQMKGKGERNGVLPIGFAWYENSCAYDSVLSIVLAIWMDHKGSSDSDTVRIFNTNHMKNLFLGFKKALTNINYLGHVRDRLRHNLQNICKDKFPWGGFTAVADILNYILATNETTVNSIITCPHDTSYYGTDLESCVMAAGRGAKSSVRSWMANWKEHSNHFCELCDDHRQIVMKICKVMPIVALDFTGQRKVPKIDANFEIYMNNERVVYILRGVIYFGDYHFTCRIVDEEGLVWYHDGIATQNSVIYEGKLGDTTLDLKKCRDKKASGAIYSKKVVS